MSLGNERLVRGEIGFPFALSNLAGHEQSIDSQSRVPRESFPTLDLFLSADHVGPVGPPGAGLSWIPGYVLGALGEL
jgi:hypothetical protein